MMNLIALPAEQAIIGCCLQGRILADRVDGLLPEHFAAESHREAFSLILASWQKGSPLDAILVHDLLRARGSNHADLAYWVECADVGFSAALLPGHIRTVRALAERRALLAAAERIAALAHESGNPGDLIAEAQSVVSAAVDPSSSGGGPRTLAEVIDTLLPELGRRREPGQNGVQTGFRDLDAKLILRPGNLVLIAARPAMGKTSFAMQIALHEAERGGAVAVFSQEMAEGELAARLFASSGRIPLESINAWQLSADEHTRFGKARQRMESLRLYIDDQPAQRLTDIRTKVQRLHRRHPLSMVVIDYLQLMESSSRAKNASRNSEVEEISRGLKALAKELGCPVVALSQLNRELERRNDKRPMLADLRDSGAIEQDADIVLMLYRDEIYNPSSLDQGTAEVLIRKYRQGATGVVRLTWMGQYTAFGDCAYQVSRATDASPATGRRARGFEG